MNTTGFLYQDECSYMGGDPRLPSPEVKNGFLDPLQATLTLKTDAIQLEIGNEKAFWPRDCISEASLMKADWGDRGGIKLAPFLQIRVRDPEGVYERGFLIELGFRSLYYARVFLKRLAEAFPGVVHDQVTGLSTDLA